MPLPSPPPAPAQPPSDRVLDLHIDLAGCEGKAELLRRVANALRFPDWFGHNWDALADSLTDLSWLPAAHYRLTIAHTTALRHASPETLDTLQEVLSEAGDYWRGEGVSFEFSFLEGPADGSTSPPPPHASPR